jgi:hypothetical protein
MHYRNALVQTSLLQEMAGHFRKGPPGPDTTTKVEREPFSPGVPNPLDSEYSRILVVAKTMEEDTTWIQQELPELQTAIYEVDNPEPGEYRVPHNKGHEAMVYLTYIIDHYDELPEIMIFVHAGRIAWHNNDLLDKDNAKVLKHLRNERVVRQGYMPLRCHHHPGCPMWLRMNKAKVDLDENIKVEESWIHEILFKNLFPGHRLPMVLSAPCCAQFAVTAERVRDNPKSMYERLRNWLLKTDINDMVTGRIFEYLWHYIFTRYHEFCPMENYCYCDGFGVCFGSAKDFDTYKKTVKKKDDTEKMIGRALQVNDEAAVSSLTEELERMKTQLRAELDEAIRRGEKKENRNRERERMYWGTV